MKLLRNPAVVVAGWGILNGVLALVLVGFGGTALEFPAYLIAAALVLVNAAAVWFVVRREPAWRQPPPGDSMFFLGLAVGVGSLGLAYAWYLTPAAVLPLILAFLRERKGRRERPPA
ncbi:MAG: hypothetical protein J2P34_00745 [Actinobacteria bacterium]|nr:hypothetical protein [Actinomycetota bacterium]